MRGWQWIVLGVLLSAGMFAWLRHAQISSAPAPIRVGVDHSPPFYSIHPDGSVTGLAVDVLNEAARRRGIQLIWTPLHDVPLDDALHARTVQMWPLVGSTPARRKEFFLTRPWLESQFVLVSRDEHPLRTLHDAEGQTIAHARLRTTTAMAHQFLNRSNLLVRLYRADAVQAVCSGEAVAALIESHAAGAVLLTRPPGCESVNFHISGLPGVTSPLSIAAVPEVRGAAEALREEIARLTQDGFLSARLEEWSPFSAEGERSIRAEEAANQRNLIYRFSLIAIGALAVLLGWFARRAGRLRKVAQSAEAELRETQRRFTAFMDHSPTVAFMKDSRGRLLYTNRAWRELFDTAAEPALLAGDDHVQTVERIHTTGDNVRSLLTITFPFTSETGERLIGGAAVDITEREAALAHVASSEARYRELFEQNPLPAWVYDRDTLAFLTVNEAAVKKYGWTREDFLSGMRLTDILAAPDALDEHVTKDGRILSVDVTSYDLDYEDRSACLTIVSDVTELENMLEKLRLSEERWQLALSGAGDALWDWDLTSGVVFRSPRWSAMLGYSQDEIGDRRDDLIRLLHPDDVTRVDGAVAAHLARKTSSLAVEYRMRHKDGTWRWIMDRGQAVWDERGAPVRLAGAVTDVTERRALQSLLENEARTDALTGLMNRRAFDRRFAQLLRESRAAGSPLTACLCDLDRFKEVNDTHGHAAGDFVLMEFGAILRQNLRKTDLVARVGGDEFMLALANTSGEHAHAIVERIREQLHSISFQAGTVSFKVSSCFGVAELRDHHSDAAALIAEADTMLYTAKSGGRNRTIAA